MCDDASCRISAGTTVGGPTTAAETTYPIERPARSGANSIALTLALVFAGFTLTSTSYLAWLYHLIDFVEPVTADGLTMIGGYSLQAVGVGIIAAIGWKRPEVYTRMPFAVIVTLHFACVAPAMMGTTFVGTLAFGYLMNILCGMIAAFYLQRLATCMPTNRRGVVFGGGYACSVLVSWLLSILPFNASGTLATLVPCLLLSVLAMSIMFMPQRSAARALDAHDAQTSSDGANPPLDTEALQNRTQPTSQTPMPSTRNAAPAGPDAMRTIITTAAFAVLMMSLVKNVGFSFPSADFSTGISLELSRLFYAVGLVIAGIVIDRSRKHGAICCLAALIMPFICMALADEPVPGMAVWALDYFFYGFFSVFRVVLFADMADGGNRAYLSGFGLMIGRIGDALGTAVCLSLGNITIALVAVAAVLFATTVFVFYRLAQLLYLPQAKPVKSEQELFEEFSARFDLSAREREVLHLLLDERSNAEIAAELFVSQSTVKFHVRNLLKKTGCKNRQELRSSYVQST